MTLPDYNDIENDYQEGTNMSEKQCRRYIQAGNCIRIKSIDITHPSARRLKAMGIEKGCDIEVERVSPFGDPCMVKVRGYSLAVRRKDFEALDMEEMIETGV
jgi:ferrous iron transport protein A